MLLHIDECALKRKKTSKDQRKKMFLDSLLSVVKLPVFEWRCLSIPVFPQVGGALISAPPQNIKEKSGEVTTVRASSAHAANIHR